VPDPGLTFFYVRTELRQEAEEIARQALDVPARCPHVPAPLVSALRPAEGTWCDLCGYTYAEELFTSTTCVRCRTRPALPGILQLPAAEYSVLTRLCEPCCLGTTPQEDAR
jgi:hypothetical protein